MIGEELNLQRAVESLHSCRATLVQTVPVRETFRGQPVWEGVVHVFDLEGHPEATRAYAWSSPIEGSEKRRNAAVLQLGAIKSPLDAAFRRRQHSRCPAQHLPNPASPGAIIGAPYRHRAERNFRLGKLRVRATASRRVTYGSCRSVATIGDIEAATTGDIRSSHRQWAPIDQNAWAPCRREQKIIGGEA
jgi:hypothetical protein